MEPQAESLKNHWNLGQWCGKTMLPVSTQGTFNPPAVKHTSPAKQLKQTLVFHTIFWDLLMYTCSCGSYGISVKGEKTDQRLRKISGVFWLG